VADPSDINDVRLNTNEPSDEDYDNTVLSDFIDALGVAGASAKVWGLKAAKYADLVDVSEAGSSERFDQLWKKALAQEALWTARAAALVALPVGPKIKTIGRD